MSSSVFGPTDTVPNALTSRYPALGHSRYRRYWLASLASVGAWQLATLSQGWLVYELSGSTLDLGVLGAAASIPTILMTFFGGVIADRFEKRTVLMVTSSITAALLAALAILDAAGVVAVWHVWVIAGLVAIVSGVDWPTRQSYFIHLIDRPAFLSAVALNSVLWQSSRMVVPAIGGLLLAMLETSVVFALSAGGYLTMLVVIRRLNVNVEGDRETSPIHQIIEGVRFVVHTPLFRQLLLLSYGSMFFAASYMQLLPAFAKLLGADATGYGMMLSAGGVGAMLGTAWVGAMRPTRHYGVVIMGAATVSTVLLYGFAAAVMASNYFLAMAMSLVAAAFASVFMILSITAMQTEVPDALRGRVMGIYGITYSLMPLGGLMLGALAAEFGAPSAVMVSLSVFLGIIFVAFCVSRDLRGLASPELRLTPELQSRIDVLSADSTGRCNTGADPSLPGSRPPSGAKP
ncbi:MAG: MFS transporter [Gammaproteobacteria bacterium]|nr:MFS transporter [Gammaproteobacteria bacterium]